MPELPSEAFGGGFGERPGEAESLEPSRQGGRQRDELGPGAVGVVVAEGHALEAGVFEPVDGVFGSGVAAVARVEFGGVSLGVGAEPAAAPEVRVEQAALRAGVAPLAAGDEPGVLGPVLERLSAFQGVVRVSSSAQLGLLA